MLHLLLSPTDAGAGRPRAGTHPSGHIKRSQEACSLHRSVSRKARGDRRYANPPCSHTKCVRQRVRRVSPAMVFRDHPRLERGRKQGGTSALGMSVVAGRSTDSAVITWRKNGRPAIIEV